MRTFLLFAFLAFALPASAQPNNIISYQAVIADSSGNPAQLSGSAITVTLYKDAGARDTLWQETSVASTSKGGVVNISLGSRELNPLPELIYGNTFLGIAINGGAELRPLSQFTTAPYAIVAQKLSTPYVTGIALDSVIHTGIVYFYPDSNGFLKIHK